MYNDGLLGLVAEVDIPPRRAVVLTSGGKVTLAANGDSPIIGITADTATDAGGVCDFYPSGCGVIVEAVTGATVNPGQALTAGAGGKLVPAPAGKFVCALAVTGASGADYRIRVIPVGYYSPASP